MGKKKIIISAFMSSVFAFSLLSGCAAESYAKLKTAAPGDGETYNTELFYRNDVTIFSADPSAIYISEEQDEEYGGYFYLYQNIRNFMYISDPVYDETFDANGNYQVKIMRSKNMSDWEDAGVMNGFGFFYSENSWINRSVWGPEIYYNEYDETTNPDGDDKYYLYFAADSKIGDGTQEYSTSSNHFDRFYLAVARSDTPVGPFSLLTSAEYYGKEGAANLNGDVITEENPQINFTKAYDLKTLDGEEGSFGCIDPQLFKDPQTDKLYLYFTRQGMGDHVADVGSYGTSSVWAMEMKDMLTPDYDTLTLVALPRYESVDASARNEACPVEGYTGTAHNQTDEGPINEGQFVLYHEGKYYLTYAKSGNGIRSYDQKQAVADSPLGPFVKIPGTEPVLGANAYNDYAVGLGHNSYFTVGNELWAVYGKFADASVGVSSGRVTAFDRATWLKTDKYEFDLLAVNGPTVSVQPLAEEISPYRNIADEAEITVSVGTGTEYLTDKFFPNSEAFWSLEYLSTGACTITLKFDEPKTVRSVLVYNSADYYYAFKQVDNIRFTLSETPNWLLAIDETADDLIFDTGAIIYPSAYLNEEEEYMRQGGAAIAEFYEISVKEISITLSEKFVTSYGSEKIPQIGIGEIVILGK